MDGDPVQHDENLRAIYGMELDTIGGAISGALAGLEEEVGWQFELGEELRSAQQSVLRLGHLLGVLEPVPAAPLPPQ